MKKIFLTAVIFLTSFALFAGCAEKTSAVTVLTKVQDTSAPQEETVTPDTGEIADCEYVLNTNSKKIHLPSCSSVGNIKEKNRKPFSGEPEELMDEGYSFCRVCMNGK